MSSPEPEVPVFEHLQQALSGEGSPCGPNLEHDPVFFQLENAVAPKDASQFGAGIPPDWRSAHALCLQLFERTRDLRVAVLLVRASVRLEGYAALAGALQLIRGLLERHVDYLHPVPDAADDPSRINALAPLHAPGALPADLSQCVLCQVRGFGELRLRDIELSGGTGTPKEDERVLTGDQLTTMLAEVLSGDLGLARSSARTVAEIGALSRTLADKAGPQFGDLLKPLLVLAKKVDDSVLKALGTLKPAEAGTAGSTGEVPSARRLPEGISHRAEAVRAIDLVCEYFERTEPTHPAPLLLRRAQRLINHNFLQLMKELAPEALNGVAGLMGVDPEAVVTHD